MRSVFAVLCLIVTLPVSLEAQKNCKKGKPCGNSCISVDKVCRIESSPTPAYVAPQSVAPAGSRAVPAENTKDWLALFNTKVYYKASCQAARELPGPYHYFSTEAEAQQVGYRRSQVPGC